MSPLQLIATVVHDNTNVTTVSLAVFVVLLLYKFFQKTGTLPPGPRPWPLVGNLFNLSFDSPHRQFVEWAKRYGNVFTVYYGPKPVVVINGYDKVQEALISKADAFSCRPDLPARNRLGIAFAPYGPIWKEQRKFTMSGLRDFGVGKRSLEGKLLEEAEALGREIIKTGGKPFNIFYLLRRAATNVICSVVFGERHDYEDSAFTAYLEDIDIVFKTPGAIVRISNFLRHIPVLGKSAKRFHDAMQRNGQLINMKVEEHHRDFDINHIRDFMDIYIKEIKSGRIKSFTNTQLVDVIDDLVLAGTDTTSQTLYWILLYMVLYPQTQERVQRELYGTFGNSAPPTTAKRSEVPFTQAVISEVQRINSTTPIALPHCTSSDTNIYGYDIPKGTLVTVNLWSVLRDPNLWEEPDQFKPERFLDNQGQYLNKNAFIPFSIGRRFCLGVQLAKMELFMFTTYLLQHFTFQLPEGAPVPSTEGKLGITMSPPPYELCAIPK